MKYTSIEWCDHTFNPWEGCSKVSPGCLNCYAETRDKRFHGGCHWGKGAERKRHGKATWRQPVRWNELAGMGRFRECSVCGRREFRKWDASLPPGGLACCSTPGCLSLPETDSFVARPRVFCLSLGDWLDPEVPIDWLIDLLDLIRRTPHLDWLLLTKRPQLWRARLEGAMDASVGKMDLESWIYSWAGQYGSATLTKIPPVPPLNVWIGTSVEDQTRADERIPHLLDIPAKVRFLSCEPLLESVDLRLRGHLEPEGWSPATHVESQRRMQGLSWAICGGESGKGARPMDPDWARSLRDQCRGAGVSFFMKQMGGVRKPFPAIPDDLAIREFPA